MVIQPRFRYDIHPPKLMILGPDKLRKLGNVFSRAESLSRIDPVKTDPGTLLAQLDQVRGYLNFLIGYLFQDFPEGRVQIVVKENHE